MRQKQEFNFYTVLRMERFHNISLGGGSLIPR